MFAACADFLTLDVEVVFCCYCCYGAATTVPFDWDLVVWLQD